LKSTSISDLNDGGGSRYTNQFKIISAEKSFIAVATNADHKSEWVQLVSAAIKMAQHMTQLGVEGGTTAQAKPAAASFQPDYEARNCTLCHSRFTLTYRRHHCRQCGRVVCQVCSNFKRELVPKQKPVKVCCVCVTKPLEWRPQGVMRTIDVEEKATLQSGEKNSRSSGK